MSRRSHLFRSVSLGNSLSARRLYGDHRDRCRTIGRSVWWTGTGVAPPMSVAAATSIPLPGSMFESRLFVSSDACSSGGDGGGDSDLKFLDDEKSKDVERFKALVDKYFKNQNNTTLDELKSNVNWSHKEYLIPHLDKFDDDDFAVRVIAYIVDEHVDVVKAKYGLLKSELKKLVVDVEFWKDMNKYKDKLTEGAFNLLEEIRDNILNGTWNLKEVQTECANFHELKFLSRPESRDDLLKVLRCILHTSSMNAKAMIECRLAAQKGFTDKLESLEVASENDVVDTSYFIGDACFRHEGKLKGEEPPKVFLSKKDEKRDYTKRPFIFYSASGTGKTVEISGSGYTRGAVLAIVHKGSDLHDFGEIENGKLKASTCFKKLGAIAFIYMCRAEYSKIIKPIINDVFEKDMQMQNDPIIAEPQVKPTLNGFGNGNANDENTISIVLAIDEASACPAFVRRIISNFDEAGKMVAEAFCARQRVTNQELKHHKIEVLFSFAGTGASNTAVGSLPNNFVHFEPSAKTNAAEVYKVLRSSFNNHDQTLPTYSDLTDKYPVLGCMVSHNARMISIFLKTLSAHPQKIKYPGTQNEIICEVFETFMGCNGLANLTKPEDQIKVASQAFAVHLFQRPFDKNKDKDKEKDNQALQAFKYGIDFDPFTDLVSTKALVSRYGILTPRAIPDEMEGNDNEPFIVDETMQLLCMWMMMQGKKQGQSDGLLQTSSFGLEVLATHIISCVVAASMTLPMEKRPTIATLLKDKLNFFMVGHSHNLQTIAKKCMVTLLNDERYQPTNDEKVSITTKMIQQADSFEELLNYYEQHKEEWEKVADAQILKELKNALDEYIPAHANTVKKEIEVFAGFQNVKAMHATYNSKKGTESVGTYFQNSEMEVKKFTHDHIKAWKDRFGEENAKVKVYGPHSDKVHPQDKIPFNAMEGEKVMCMDSELFRRLFDMEYATVETAKDLYAFSAPLTTLAWGASPMADGHLVFYGQKVQEDGTLGRDYFRCSIAVQAKDSLGVSDLPFGTSIKNNRKREEDQTLNEYFGANRLYCLASYDEKLKRGITNSDESVIGFPLDKSPILTVMMKNLAVRRGAQNAAYEFGTQTVIAPSTENEAREIRVKEAIKKREKTEQAIKEREAREKAAKTQKQEDERTKPQKSKESKMKSKGKNKHKNSRNKRNNRR